MKISMKPTKVRVKINKTERIYPALENLEVTPSTEEQIFNHPNSYGYDEVKINAVEGKAIEITPTTESQHYAGLYGDITVNGIESEELKVTPSAEEQIHNGLYKKVIVAGTGRVIEITNAMYLFYNNARIDYLKEILKLCKKPTSVEYMFYNANKITELDLSDFDTSNVTSMSNMFVNCSNLANINLSNFNTSKVTNMGGMFQGTAITNIDLSSFNTSKVTTMMQMFSSCSSLVELDLSNFDTSSMTDMQSMFYNNSKLETLNISSFDASKVYNIRSAFASCSKLTNLQFCKNLGKGFTIKSANYNSYKIDMSSSTNLTYESLMDIINNLYDLNLTYDVANGGTLYRQSLVLGSTNLAKLTEEEIAIATNKGWNVT